MLASHLQDAIVACQQALRLGEGVPEACQTLGTLLQGTGQFQEAVRWQTQSLSPPPPAVLLAQLGALCAKQQAYPQAIELYQQALAHDPTDAESYRVLASLYQRLGDRQAEMLHRHQAVRLNPDWATPANQLRLGNALMEQDSTAAIDCYQRALDLRPDFLEAHYNLAIALMQQQQLQAAAAEFQAALAIAPHAPSCYGLGLLAGQQNDWEAAIQYYRETIALDADSVGAYYGLGDAYSQQQNYPAAIEAYQQGLAKSPFAWGYQGLGYAHLQQQNFAAAVTALQQAIAQQPDRALTYFHLAEALAGIAQSAEAALPSWDAAITAYEQAIERDPAFPWAYHNLIELWLRQSNWQRATELARQAIAANPSFAWAYTQLGRSLTAQGKLAEAIGCYQQAAHHRGWTQCLARGYRFTQDWFTHNIPVWQEIFGPIAHLPLQIIEVGSFQGMSACWLLDRVLAHREARLVCIDPNFQPEFRENLAKTGKSAQVSLLKGSSHDFLPQLVAQAYDIIYIDGCHWANHVQEDARLAWPLLKPGGLMIFDDYQWADPERPGEGTQLGIDRFLASISSAYEEVHRGYQLIIRKPINSG